MNNSRSTKRGYFRPGFKFKGPDKNFILKHMIPNQRQKRKLIRQQPHGYK